MSSNVICFVGCAIRQFIAITNEIMNVKRFIKYVFSLFYCCKGTKKNETGFAWPILVPGSEGRQPSAWATPVCRLAANAVPWAVG
jgi:hypothetical protein